MRQRAPKLPTERLGQGVRSQRVGAAGLVYNAAPVPDINRALAKALGSTIKAGSATALWYDDEFTLTADGAQSVTLTYLPIDVSEDVKLNGIGARRTTEWTRSGTTLTLDADLDARTGDILTVHYQYLSGMPASVQRPGSDYDQEVMADNPIAYWLMNEPSGTAVADFTTHGHTGTLSGTGIVRNTASLMPTDTDASTEFQYLGGSGNGHFTVADDAAFDTSAFTLEFWTNRGASGAASFYEHQGRVRLLLQGGNAHLEIWSGGAWVNLASAGGTGYTSPFRHYAVTYDGANVRFYHDGALHSAPAASAALPNGTGNLIVGPYWGIGTVEDDRLQKVAVYGTALSAARIAAHWAAA